MRVTGLALIPPKAAESNPKVTPELLASSLARYSRSNKGIESILGAVDWSNPDKSVDAIFKFVDYGHASISGLTGGIAMTMDDCSMLLVYKLFEIAQLSDGQESSTRYIQMTPASLPEPEEVGISSSLAAEWKEVMTRSFAVYQQVYEQLDKQARETPEIVRVPKNANEKVVDRLRKNYALDRARYLIPLATKTNAGLVMTARVWAQTIRQLDALPLPEAQKCAALMRTELEKFTPRLIRHSVKDEATIKQGQYEIDCSRDYILKHGASIKNLADKVFVSVHRESSEFLPDIQTLSQAFDGKANRYSLPGEALRRIMVRFGWNNISIAELRDLNRHRSGYRFTPLSPVGFYLPKEVQMTPEIEKLLKDQSQLVQKLARTEPANGSHLYGYLLGVQTPFEHSTHADKFIYEVELRTGMGAHYRYAEHCEAVYREFAKKCPEVEPYVQIGTAEPE